MSAKTKFPRDPFTSSTTVSSACLGRAGRLLGQISSACLGRAGFDGLKSQWEFPLSLPRFPESPFQLKLLTLGQLPELCPPHLKKCQKGVRNYVTAHKPTAGVVRAAGLEPAARTKSQTSKPSRQACKTERYCLFEQYPPKLEKGTHGATGCHLRVRKRQKAR